MLCYSLKLINPLGYTRSCKISAINVCLSQGSENKIKGNLCSSFLNTAHNMYDIVTEMIKPCIASFGENDFFVHFLLLVIGTVSVTLEYPQDSSSVFVAVMMHDCRIA